MMTERLTPRKRVAIENLVQGKTILQTSQLVGVSERQVYRWMDEPLFRKELNRVQLNTLQGVSRRLVQLAGDAVDALESLMKEPGQPGASIRVRVSLGVMDVFFKYREMIDTEQRVTELEKVVFNGRKR